jgi:class 3 adenylate cyclase
VRPSTDSRRLATVLFLDIVGSTHVASDLGDARWRTLLTRFRKVVREQLRNHAGREGNFTGDGFLATFGEPARAIAAGVGIARGVQALGVDVRVGLHTGEVETIQGHLGGVAVHIGARVMALAGRAEVLVTSTVKDLVHGSPIDFDDLVAHELKGIPGTWQVTAVRSVDGEPVPSPVDPAAAIERLGEIAADDARRGRRRAIVVAGVVALAAVVGALVLVVTTAADSALSLVKLDARNVAITSTVDDGLLSDHLWHALSVENGALFQMTPTEVRTRDLATGSVRETFHVGADHERSVIGFGSEWLGADRSTESLVRVDLVSGERVASLDIDGGTVALAVGPDAVWFVTSDGDLGRVDPITLELQRWSSGARSAGAVVPFAENVWICDCDNRQIFRFDVATERFKRFDIPEEAFLVGPTQESAPAQLWLVDTGASAVTPLDPVSGERGRAIGFEGTIADAQIGLGKIWVAAADHVYVLDANDDEADVVDIAMPEGFFASSVAIDADRFAVWIGTCGCPLE